MENENERLWIDGHTHVTLHDPAGGVLGVSHDDVLEVLDRSGADLRLFCSAGEPEMRRIAEQPEALHWVNEALFRFIEPAPGRLFASCFIHPGAVKQSHKDLDTFIGERGFVQVGEIEGILGFDLDSLEMLDLARHAAELGAPLQMHCSTNALSSGEHIRQALHVAREVPEAKVIIAHAIGGRNTYQYILAAETYLANGGDNVYLEIRDFHVRGYLRSAYEHLGPDRLLVGMDWIADGAPPFLPYGTAFGFFSHPTPSELDHWGVSKWGTELWLSPQLVIDLSENLYPCSVASLVGFLREAGIGEEDIDKIGSGNAIELFGLGERLGDACNADSDHSD
jgi:predicted TIM-barrel fold metal-dependent hydrolase